MRAAIRFDDGDPFVAEDGGVVAHKIFELRAAEYAPADARLVCDDKQQIPCLQHAQSLEGARDEYQVVSRVEVARILVDCAVPVEEDSGAHGASLRAHSTTIAEGLG